MSCRGHQLLCPGRVGRYDRTQHHLPDVAPSRCIAPDYPVMLQYPPVLSKQKQLVEHGLPVGTSNLRIQSENGGAVCRGCWPHPASTRCHGPGLEVADVRRRGA
ncbi:hypothetical protein MUN80_13180 [Hymenobacter cellulosivorans]|uniref:Uncharacterized protein n=1 Tax=Hymenobacter cellulosivorans TaxID=2932249 RepID=A0ABY4F3G5_9BACT|nr:hypothetical protein [Hymenobacter cellulosivorans]UOQ50712.1 hypothetical protein MUN80_13180 [Hymenobacter cellulosivorans]